MTFKRGDGIKFRNPNNVDYDNNIYYGRFCYQSHGSSVARVEVNGEQMIVPIHKLHSIFCEDSDVK